LSIVRRNSLALGAATAAVFVGLVAFLVVRADSRGAGVTAPSGAANAIAQENAKPGTPGWQIDRPALDGQIQAYTGQVSVQRGDPIDLYVSTADDAAVYDVDVYRMGWYGGAGARLVRSVKDVTGEDQGHWTPARGLERCKTCTLDPSTMLMQANWKRSLSIETGADWVNGYYVARLHELKSDTATYAIFVVRDDASNAPIVVQASTNTWEAYNTWGDASLYGSFGADRKYVSKTRRAYRVSYDRPYDATLRGGKSYGAGEFFSWEYDFVRWAEAHGYDMSYTTNVDVSRDAQTLRRHRVFISLGHDEYWTKAERDNVEAARDAGVNVAFFGGNEAYWQARLDASASGKPGRILTEYKDTGLDPMTRSDPTQATVQFAGSPINRPESMLSGLAYGSNATPDYQTWRPVSTGLWIFAGSGIKEGDTFRGIVGYEYDHMPPPGQRPSGLVILARSPVQGFLGDDTACSSMYVARSGAVVFDAGTVGWAWGLDDFGHEALGRFADERLRRVTSNIMDRLSSPAGAARTGS
jgi:hypothetical protein